MGVQVPLPAPIILFRCFPYNIVERASWLQAQNRCGCRLTGMAPAFQAGYCGFESRQSLQNVVKDWAWRKPRLTYERSEWFIQYVEVSEWFKEPVLKTGDSARGRGFKSHPLRQCGYSLMVEFLLAMQRVWVRLPLFAPYDAVAKWLKALVCKTNIRRFKSCRHLQTPTVSYEIVVE